MTSITFGMTHLRLESIHLSIHLSMPLSSSRIVEFNRRYQSASGGLVREKRYETPPMQTVSGI
jgi:hypothetical protein